MVPSPHPVKQAGTPFPKMSSQVLDATRTPTVAAALGSKTKKKSSLWAHVHLELIPWLP